MKKILRFILLAVLLIGLIILMAAVVNFNWLAVFVVIGGTCLFVGLIYLALILIIS